MTPISNQPVMILAGGASRRFGAPKGLAVLSGQRLIDRTMAQMRRQSKAEIAVNADAAGPYAGLGFDLVPDVLAGQLGPLSGLHAAMGWAQALGYDHVATVPVDTPFLPDDLLAKLEIGPPPAIGSSRDRNHFVCGLWPVALKADLEAFLLSDQRAAGAWVRHCRARSVPFPDTPDGRDPFFNINTPDDLQEAAHA